MADDLAKLRAELNIGAIDTPNFIKAIQAAYQNMPGAGVAQAGLAAGSDLLGGLAGNLYGVGKQALSGQLGNLQAGNQAYADAQKVAQALHYNPPTQAGQDIYNAYNAVGEATGPLPELWNTPMRFTPDDLRVAGRTVTQDIRNFPSDYANAQAGITREYPTLGSRAAGATDAFGQAVMPIAERINQQVMETGGIKVPGVPDLFNIPVASYAVKSGGGNNPLNMGSTLPLKEQGRIGTHLSEMQIADPYEKWLDLLKERRGDAEYYFNKFVNEKKSSGELGDQSHFSEVAWKEKLQKIAEEYTRDYNKIKSEENENHIPILSPSQLEKIAPVYNAWGMNPYQKYITNQMGTGLPTDPYLKEINEANIPLHELFGLNPGGGNFTRAEDAKKRREQFLRYYKEGFEFDPNAPQNANIGKQTATTEFGKQLEDYLDSTLYPSHPYSFNEQKFPQVSKIPAGAVVTDFLTSDPWKQTGLHAIQDRMMRDLAENKLDINKISNRTPAFIVRDMIKEYKEKQNSKAVIQKKKDDWRAARFASLQSDVPYEDGSKMHIITPEDVKADENLAMRDLGLSTIDLNQCVGAGCRNTPEYPNVHGPYIEPHTGQVTKGAYPYEDTHIKRYMDRLKNGKAEIARLIDPNGIAQATVALNYETPRVLRVSQQKEVADKWLENHDPQGLIEFEQNFATFGIAEALKNVYQLYPELYEYIDKLNKKPTKDISEMKGKDNSEIEPKYVPHMVEWLNQHADELTSVRDLGNLKEVHDLDNHYDAIGKMSDQRGHWYSPTIEQFFNKVEDENLLPRFFTTDQFAQLATDYGVDLSAEPPRQLKDWEKQHISEELYKTLTKHPESLFLQDNFKEEMAEPLKLILGDETPGVELPLEIHGKLGEMLLDHNGKYKDVLDSALAQLAEDGPGEWVKQFSEQQKSKMLNIMAGWFDKHPSIKLPTNTDFDKAIAKHPNPFDEVTFYDQPWDTAPDNYWKHPETLGNTNALVEAVRNMEPELNELDQVTAIRQHAYETLSETIRRQAPQAFEQLRDNHIIRQAFADVVRADPTRYGISNYAPALQEIIIDRFAREGFAPEQ
jgi:hypothetical protein